MNLKENAKKAEAILKILANQKRLIILCHLSDGRKSAGELTKAVDLSHSALSQHLSKMKNLNLVEDCVFVGDTIFTPRMGTARTDFPGGSAKTLYHSIWKLLSLPNETKIFIGHDYPEEGKEPQFLCTVLNQKKNNILINETVSEAQYVEARNKRDVGKAVPKLLLPSIHIRA
jgi:DNA-binding transcriptional ArsR family regulator